MIVDQERARIAEDNRLAFARLRMSLPGHDVFDDDLALRSIPNRPAGMCLVNRLQLSDDPELFETQVDQILLDYRRRGTACDWLMSSFDTPADAHRRLRKRHFMGPRYIPGMVLELAKIARPEVRHLAEPIEDWSVFEETWHPWAWWAPKAQRKDMTLMLRQMEERPERDVKHLIVWVDGKPACGASLFLDGEVAGVYGVVTIEEFRGQGAALSATLAVLDLAKELGAKWATLQAAPGKAGLYEKFGFETVCSFTSMYYSKTRSVDDANRLGIKGPP